MKILGGFWKNSKSSKAFEKIFKFQDAPIISKIIIITLNNLTNITF